MAFVKNDSHISNIEKLHLYLITNDLYFGMRMNELKSPKFNAELKNRRKMNYNFTLYVFYTYVHI